jgi:hypothetical protein
MRIAENQCPAAPRPHSHSVPRPAAGFDPDEVVAQALELVFNTAAPGISNRNNTNERAYADGYSNDGEPTPNPVPIQSSESFAENGFQIHQ